MPATCRYLYKYARMLDPQLYYRMALKFFNKGG
jgi:hypothetical protein